MFWSSASKRKYSLAACAAALVFGCGDGDADASAETDTETETTSTSTSTGAEETSSTGETEDPASAVELRPDLCDDPANAALLMGLLEGGLGDGEPSYGQRNPEQLQRMAAAPLAGPFYMVNLIRYRERAVYADGRDTELSGKEANALYSPLEFLEAIGASVVFTGPVSETSLGGSTEWDDVAIVEYPCPLALFAMAADPEFQARSIHKDAGLETSIVMVTHRRVLGDPGPQGDPFPPTMSDPSFEHVQVVRLRDEARYDQSSEEPDRSGDEALGLYAQAFDEVSSSYGFLPRARLDVEGVFIGDGRAWDEVWIDFVPSSAAWDALQQDSVVVAAQHHFDAAVEEAYGLPTEPVLSVIPGAAEGGASGSLPVTPDGTGTQCEVDADCPGNGVDKCLNPDGTGGFCTREGCGAGECEAPYACCRDCSEDVVELLPFEDSACLPASGLGQLTQPPASCTCD